MLGVIRTIYDRCDNIVTDPMAKKVRQQLDKRNSIPKNKDTDKKQQESPIMVTIPYVKGVSETRSRLPTSRCIRVDEAPLDPQAYACTPERQKDTP